MGILCRVLVLWAAVSASGVFAETHLLDQGWTRQEREEFWFAGQGSEIIPYDWLLHLRTEDGSSFLDEAHIRKMGYMPASYLDDSDRNPDGLPVGFVKTVDPDDQTEWFGFNCSACHANYLTHEGHQILIDGGPTMANIEIFLASLEASLSHTLAPAEFERFATDLLGNDPAPDKVSGLRAQMTQLAASWASYQELTHHEHEYGYGRLDALGAIYNRVLVQGLGVPGNRAAPEAPVSYPHLWQTGQADWVQWNGDSYNQVRFLAIMRSIVEQLGVFARFEISATGDVYDSSMQIEQTKRFLELIYKLKSPVWPAGLLPVPSLDQAARGRIVFQDHCASCHVLVDRSQMDRPYAVTLEPQVNVQTDPATSHAAIRTVSPGILTGRRLFPIIGPRLEAEESAFSVLIHVAMGVARDNTQEVYLETLDYATIRAFLNYVTYWGLDLVQPRRQYKAGPLNGVWATAPYLHNGSVPNLNQLLMPADKRSTQFFVGCREFDAGNIGYAQPASPIVDADPNLSTSAACDIDYTSRFDTTLPGNSNAGHEYGVTGDDAMTAAEREDLLEFLKVL